MRVPLVINDGNGRSGRDAGNNGFRTVGGREDGRVDEVGEARGDETSGRVVLSEMDMSLNGMVRRQWRIVDSELANCVRVA
jgi:hypothetical protein